MSLWTHSINRGRGLIMCQLLALSCDTSSSVCTPQLRDAADAGDERQPVFGEPIPSVDWLEFIIVNISENTWTRRQFFASGEATFEDERGDVVVSLSTTELGEVLRLASSPGFLKLLTVPPLHCDGAMHTELTITVQFSNGVQESIGDIAGCLAPGYRNLDIGQVTYEAEHLLELAGAFAIKYLDCPHPTELQDGLYGDEPEDLGSLCQEVWYQLSAVESRACAAGEIAADVWDCYK